MAYALKTVVLILATLVFTSAWAPHLSETPLAVGPDASPKDPPAGDRTSVSRRFPDLDAYLAYLEKRSHLGGSWYREIRPGVYELQTGNLRLPDGDRKRIFTREELARKFGYSSKPEGKGPNAAAHPCF